LVVAVTSAAIWIGGSSAPPAPQPTPPKEDLLRPRFKMETEPPLPTEPKPAPSKDLVRRAPVPQEQVEAGDGGELWSEALSLLPAANLRVQRGLEALANDPRVKPSDEVQRYLREAWPAIQLVPRAAQAKVFTRPAPQQDLTRPRLLALAALARGQMDLNGGATALGARWACYVIRLGHRLAASAPLLEEGLALGLARLGETWLSHALRALPWSGAELAWVRARVDELSKLREATEQAGSNTERSEDPKLLAAHQGAREQERAALRELAQLAYETTAHEGGTK